MQPFRWLDLGWRKVGGADKKLGCTTFSFHNNNNKALLLSKPGGRRCATSCNNGCFLVDI